MLVLVIWPLYPSNWIFYCTEWLTPMRRLDSKAKASLHSSPCPHCTRIAREKDIRTVAHVPQPAKGTVWMLTVVSSFELVLVIWPLSIQLDIPVPRAAHTHEAPRFEGKSEPPLHPTLLKIGCTNSS